MKKPWKFTLIAISLLLILILPAAAQPQPLTIVTTIFPAYDFSRIITAGASNVSMLLPPGADSHSFEPSPQDIIKIQTADLFIIVGGESEAWVDQILTSLGDKAPRTLTLLNAVTPVPEEIVAGMQAEAEESGSKFNAPNNKDGDKFNRQNNKEGNKFNTKDNRDNPNHDYAHDGVVYDEHIWTSPANAILIANAIAAELGEINPDQAAFYNENAAALVIQLQTLDQSFRDLISTAKRKTIIVGDRFPFRYLMDAYGLTYYAAFPGCSADVDPSAATIAFLIDKTKAEGIPVVFYLENSNHSIANTIASASGAKALLLHSAHNVTSDDLAKGVSYLSLMNFDVEQLRQALN